jgi:hypothetical protein
VDLGRGAIAGALGMFGDMESIGRLPYELITGNESPTFLPTSEDVLKRIPFGSDSPAGQFASGLGSIAGGSAPVGPAYRAVKAGAKGVKKGALAAARAGERLAERAVPQIMERGGAGADVLSGLAQGSRSNVIKPKGGNWLGGNLMGNMDESVKRLKPYRDPEKSLEGAEASLRRHEGDPRMQHAVEPQRRVVDDYKKKVAVNKWVESNIGKYVKNQMATPEDPIRLLLDKRTKEIEAKHAKDMERAERVAQRAMDEPDPRRQANMIRESERLKMEANVERQFAMDSIIPSRMQDYSPDADQYLKQRRQEAGFPAEGMGESEAAKRYETLTDDAISTMRAGDVQAAAGAMEESKAALQLLRSKEDEIQQKFNEHILSKGLSEGDLAALNSMPMKDKAAIIQDPEYQELFGNYSSKSLQTMSPEYVAAQQNPFISKLTPETQLYSGNTADMGFDHVIDILKQDVMEGRIRPEQLSKVSVEDAVRRTMDFDQEAARKMAEAQIKAAEGFPIYKEYPEGYRWVELTMPEPKMGEGYRIIKDEPSPSNWKAVPHPDGDGYALRADNGQYAFGNRSYAERKWNTPDEARAEIPNYAEIQEPYPDEVYKILDSSGNIVSKAETEKQALNQLNRDEREKVLADALKYEGDTMGHCVGGYCPDVLEGKSRIYSLRDAKGEPHVTVEVKPANLDHGMWYQSQPQEVKDALDAANYKGYNVRHSPQFKEAEAALPPIIKQIKGKQNARPIEKYDKYTQDFVKSGKYSEVGDLQNTGLFKLGNDYMTEAEAAAKYKPITQEALNFLETHPAFEQHRVADKAYSGFKGDPLAPEYREVERAAGEPVSPSVPYTYRELRALLSSPEDWTDRNGTIYQPISRAIEKLNEAKKELGIDLPPQEGMARGGRVHFSDNPDVMMLELAGGGLVKGLKAAAKAVKGTQEVLPKVEREENLQKFLGNSRIRERLYHATPKDFKQFKPGGDDPTMSGPAIWLTPDATKQPAAHNIGSRTQEFREGVNVMPVHVQARSPLMLDDKLSIEWARDVFADGSREFPDLISPKTIEELKKEGYDSIIHADPYGNRGGEQEIIMFEPNKIKSAIGNRGTYDIEDPDITKAEGGAVHMAAGGIAKLAKLARAPAKSKQEIEAIAERLAPQVTGEYVRKDAKSAKTVAGKTQKQFQREKTLPVDVRPTGEERVPELVDIEKLKGDVMIGIPGDPTLTGKTLYSVGDFTLGSPSPQHGGPLYGLYNDDAFWASGIGPARGVQNLAKRASKQYDAPVKGNYIMMGPDSINYAQHFADANLQAIDLSRMTKAQVDQFNELIRKGSPKSGPRESFPGIEDKDSAYLQMSMDPELRKHFNALMQMPTVTETLNLPSGTDIRFAITEPSLRDLETGVTGYSMGKMRPDIASKELPLSTHPTYDYDIPGEFMGQSRYPMPYELSFPDTLQSIRANPKQARQEFGSLKMVGPRQIVDQQMIDEIKAYEERMKQLTGKKAGGKISANNEQQVQNPVHFTENPDAMRLALTKRN